MLPQPDKFWNRVDVRGPDECWEWTGNRLNSGYGRCWPKHGMMMMTHRVAWELANGRPPAPGMFIMHICDNRPCCNPAHLREGTHQENDQDRFQKGRDPKGDDHWTRKEPGRVLRGEDQGNSKLTEPEVAEIRWLRTEERLTYKAIAERFQVTDVLVGMIVRGEIWAPDGKEKRAARKGIGRQGVPKINLEIAREIRKVRAETGRSFRDIGRQFGLSNGTIGEVCRNERWIEPPG